MALLFFQAQTLGTVQLQTISFHFPRPSWAAVTNHMDRKHTDEGCRTQPALMTLDPADGLQGLNSPICPLEVADSLSAQQVVPGRSLIR